jgi:hypothetical protein
MFLYCNLFNASGRGIEFLSEFKTFSREQAFFANAILLVRNGSYLKFLALPNQPISCDE